jgi:transcriptional regulator with XRE-family HTH domain
MGRRALRKPKHLARKLRQIRKTLDLSQNELIDRMGLTGQVRREEISDFERGKRLPPLLVLLEYARAANVYVDVLIDDEMRLPTQLPAPDRRI